MLNGYDGVKIFTATKALERQRLGEDVTEWLSRQRVDVVDTVVRQSSDHSFHCLSIILFYRNR